MKNWLKFFGLSFFSDKIAKGAMTRGVMNCVLGLILTLVFIFCGVLAANTVPFYTHYDNASQFRAVVYDTVSALPIEVGDGRISADTQVNTLLGGDDADLYAKNGYNVVIDTRPSTALDDFEAYCLSKDGKTEITYEEYLSLSDEDKGGYDFKLRYTPNELVLTDELVSKYEEFLSNSEDDGAGEKYAELAASKNEIPAEEYRLKAYTLYIATYYPDISAFERAGDVPLLRSYYYRNYLNSNDVKKSLFMFSDVMFAFFDTDDGLSITLYGSFESARGGMLTADNADEFIKAVFGSSVSTSANIYLMNTCKYIPLIVFIPLVLAFVAKLFFTATKNAQCKKYAGCLKVECSYLAWASLFSALILFVCGFFVSSNVLNVLPLIVFGAVMAVRTAAYLIGEAVIYKRAKRSEPEQTT